MRRARTHAAGQGALPQPPSPPHCNKPVVLQLIACKRPCPSLRRDTAGQERYLSLAPLYYRGAHAGGFGGRRATKQSAARRCQPACCLIAGMAPRSLTNHTCAAPLARPLPSACVVYSIDSRESFEKARYWVDQLQRNARDQ